MNQCATLVINANQDINFNNYVFGISQPNGSTPYYWGGESAVIGGVNRWVFKGLVSGDYKWYAKDMNGIIVMTGTQTVDCSESDLESAIQSAYEAEQSAIASANSATEASESATTATTKATEAEQSAMSASESATEASESATTATTKATEAEQSAMSASESATTATTKATEAEQSATDAQSSAEQSLSILENIGNIVDGRLQVVSAKASVTMPFGTPVYVIPADNSSSNALVAPASASSEATSSKTLGFTIQPLNANGLGDVCTHGELVGFNTSTATQGDPVYLGATAGTYVFGLANKPVPPLHAVYLGVVTHVHATQGKILVNVQNGFEMNELHDVLITNKQDGDVILYEATSGIWKNKKIMKELSSSVINPTEIPDYKGQIGLFVDGSVEYYYIARSLTASQKWELLSTKPVIITDLNAIPQFRGQIASYQGNYYLGISLGGSGTSNWELMQLSNNGLKALSSSVINPTEIPDYKGQIGVYTDSSSKQTFFVARSTTASQKWEVLLTTPIVLIYPTDLTIIPQFRGQIASYQGNYYLGISLGGSGTSNWELIQGGSNGLKSLTSSVINPTEIPDYKGQIGVFVDALFNQTFFVARSLTATQKWEKIHNDYTLTQFLSSYLPNYLNTYLTSNSYMKSINALIPITSNNSNPTEVPSYKGQIGLFVDPTNNPKLEVPFISRSIGASQKWIGLLSTLNFKYYIPNDILTGAKLVSQKQHKYAHAGYSVRMPNDRYIYTIYMANDVETFEGGDNQKICMTKMHILDNSDKTYFTVASPAMSAGITLDNAHIQVPNILQISDTVFRCFFRPQVSGEQVIAYRDFSITTQLFSNINLCSCKIKGESTVVSLNKAKAYEHYEFYNGSMGETYREVFFTSDMRILSDGNVYTALALGSGLDKVTSSILAKSSDNGSTWELLCAVNPKLLPGTDGIDSKYFWEGAVTETANSFVLFGRGVSSGAASGFWRTDILKTNLYAHGGFIKISNYSNQKPAIFRLNSSTEYIVNEGASSLYGNLFSARTSLEFIRKNNDLSYISPEFSVQDANGVHTPSVFQYKDTFYMSYSSSCLREPQIRIDGSGNVNEYYGNTTEIYVVELNRKYFL